MMAHTVRNPYAKRVTHTVVDTSSMGFIVRKMPPRQKIINDIRERECKDQVKAVKHGGKDVC